MTPDALYPFAFWAGLGGGAPAPLPRTDLSIHPETGVFSFVGAQPEGTLVSTYHFGFSAAVGAGGFDPRILSDLEEPAAVTTVSAATGLATALGALADDALVVIGDSLTYPGLTATVTLASGKLLVLRAARRRTAAPAVDRRRGLDDPGRRLQPDNSGHHAAGRRHRPDRDIRHRAPAAGHGRSGDLGRPLGPLRKRHRRRAAGARRALDRRQRAQS